MMECRNDFFLLIVCLLLAGCWSDAPRISEIIDATRRNVAPSVVDIGGIRLRQSELEVKNVFPNMQCESKGNGVDVCTWKSAEEKGRKGFKGVERLKLTFYGSELQTIEVQYFEMFDVEYANFEQGVKNKYGYAIAGWLIDSSGNEWEYDSLKVILSSHKRPHWTGTMFVFTPALEFQDRTLYRKWLNEVDQRKSQTVY
jgi:hypothetical protein